MEKEVKLGGCKPIQVMDINGISTLLDRASRMAPTSDHSVHKHVCFVFFKNTLLAADVNMGWRHAEERAIRRTSLWKDYLHRGKKFPGVKRKGLIVWSFRIAKNGLVRNAKPCEICEDMMRKIGIDKVYYSDEQGELQCLIL